MRIAFFYPLFDPSQVLPSSSRFPYELMSGLLEEAENANVKLDFFDATTRASDFLNINNYQKYDGFIGHLHWCDLSLQEKWVEMESIKPCICLAVGSRNPRTNIVGLDENDAARKIAEHLAEKGHLKAGFLSVDNQEYTLRRVTALRQALSENGIELIQEWCPSILFEKNRATSFVSDWDYSTSTYKHPPLMEWEKRREKLFEEVAKLTTPKLFICETDTLAWHFHTWMRAQGLKTPEDIALVGYNNDLITFEPYGHNILTSTHQDFKEIGRQAVKLLISLIHKNKVNQGQCQWIKGPLKIRRSTNHTPTSLGGNNPKQFKQDVNEWLEKNFFTKNTAFHLATYFGIRKAYLLQKYKKVCGLEFNEVVNQLRVTAAALRLRSTTESILVIQKEVGFENHQTLNRHFKNRFHCTPSEYRAQLLFSKSASPV